MAKYTADDPDITYLDKYDQINYNFDLLKHDVDKNQEPYIGRQSVRMLTNPNQIGDMFKSPRQFTVAIYSLAMLLATVMIFVFIIVMLILHIVGGPNNEIRFSIMKEMFFYFLCVIFVLVILYAFLNKISLEATATGFLAR